MSADAVTGRTVKGLPLFAAEITAGYGGSPIIHGISISVEPGEVVSIVGPNGSGKSTFLKSLVGIVRIDSGRVVVGEQEVTNWPPESVARIGVGYVPQVDDVFAPLSVRENLEMGGYLLRPSEVAGRLEHVVELFPQLGRMLRRRAGKLSGGERKMLAMGRALMLEPSVIVLDEPTANLAPAVARTVLVRSRPPARADRRVGTDRRAASEGSARDLRPDLRPRRRPGPHGRQAGRPRRERGIRALVPRRTRADHSAPDGRGLSSDRRDGCAVPPELHRGYSPGAASANPSPS